MTLDSDLDAAWSYWEKRTGHRYKQGIPESMRLALSKMLVKYGLEEVRYSMGEPIQKYLDFSANPERAAKKSLAHAWDKLGGVLYRRKWTQMEAKSLVLPKERISPPDDAISEEEFRHFEGVYSRFCFDTDDYSYGELLDGFSANHDLFVKALRIIQNSRHRSAMR